MELQKILPELVKEVVKQTLESIMTAEREVFIKENGGTKNGFYVRNPDTVLGKLKNLKIPRDSLKPKKNFRKCSPGGIPNGLHKIIDTISDVYLNSLTRIKSTNAPAGI